MSGQPPLPLTRFVLHPASARLGLTLVGAETVPAGAPPATNYFQAIADLLLGVAGALDLVADIGGGLGSGRRRDEAQGDRQVRQGRQHTGCGVSSSVDLRPRPWCSRVRLRVGRGARERCGPPVGRILSTHEEGCQRESDEF